MEKHFSLSENFQFSIDTTFRYFDYFIKLLLFQIASWVGLAALIGVGGPLLTSYIYSSKVVLLNSIAEKMKVEIAAGNMDKAENLQNSLNAIVGSTRQIIFLLIVAIFLLFIFYQFVSLGYSKIQLNFIEGKKNTLSTLFSQGRLIGRGVLASIIYFVCCYFLYIFFLVPGIIFSILFGFYQLVLVDEQVGVIESFRRSLAISRGARMQIFALSLITLLFYAGVALAFFPALIFFSPALSLMFAYAYRSLKQQTDAK